MRIAVVTDSSAGIDIKEEKDLGIYVARMPLIINGQEFIDAVDLTRNDFILRMKDGAIVKTSQPSVGHLVTLFDDLLKKYEHIIFLPISSKLSGTYQTALSLKQEYGDQLTVIDSLFVSAPLRLLALDVKKMVEEGKMPKEIKSIVEHEAYMWSALIPENLTYLKRGGRIKPAAAALANMMKIVPILKVDNGEIDVVDKVRTFKKASKLGLEKVIDMHDPKEHRFIVLNGDCDEDLYDKIVRELEKHIGKPVIKTKLYPIVLAHTGPGSIGIAAVKKIEKESQNGRK